MQRKYTILIAVLLVAVVAAWQFNARHSEQPTSLASAATPAAKTINTSQGQGTERWIAAPGRVEPISEEIKLGAELSGKLKAVLVEEGQRVQRGQVIALLEDSDYRARVAAAEASLLLREAELRRVLNGARDQERREARAAIKEAEALRENARTELERRQSLYRTGDIAREEAERAQRQYDVAYARYQAAVERHSFVDAAAREEDRARAEAAVASAKAQIAETRALLDKTVVRAPLGGVVLRKHLKTGESVSSGQMGGGSQAIVTLADDSRLRVRVEVDETDIGRLQVGQRAYVRADAYGEKQFQGQVIRIGEVLGRKAVLTDQPVEKVDTKVLEVLLELEPGEGPKLGLRVDAFINVSGNTP